MKLFQLLPCVPFVLCLSLAKGLSCMRPSDARYVTTSAPIPHEWVTNSGWHTGAYLSVEKDAPLDTHSDQKRNRGVMFSSNGTRVWWLRSYKNSAYHLITQDRTRILCAHTVGGLRIDWFENTASNREEDWCSWDVEVNPREQNFFRIKNHVFTEMMPEVGYVYFDKTGLYFDYDENSHNDVRNVIDDARKWFAWEKVDATQRDFNAMEQECTMGPSGVPDFLEESSNGIITARSVGGRRRRVSNYFVSSDRFAKCKGGWYLYSGRCYKLFRSVMLTQQRGKRVCTILKGTLVTPKTQSEQSFLVRLLKRFDASGRYWLGIQRKDTGTRFYDSEGHPLVFRRWARNRSTFRSDKCVYWRNRRWYQANCESKQKLMCVREATVKTSISCGKIQERTVDTLMRKAAGLTRSQDRIVNGVPAEEGQFPWQASIRFKIPVRFGGVDVIHNCGGTLVDECWVVTAAHCVPEQDESMFTVRLGDLNNEVEDGTEQEFNIERIILHEEYSMFPSPRFDIALIKLQPRNGKCATFNRVVQPACLPDPSAFPIHEGQLCQVSGWGVTNTSLGQSSAARNLQWVTLPKMTDDLCARRYNRRDELFREIIMICAGLKSGGQDACTGDSGGPYVCRNEAGSYALVGVVSFGIGCARSSYPGVYTNVAHFIPWISEKINAHGGGNVVS